VASTEAPAALIDRADVVVTGPGELDTASLAAAVDCEGLHWTRTEALAETTVGGKTEVVSGSRKLQEEHGHDAFNVGMGAEGTPTGIGCGYCGVHGRELEWMKSRRVVRL